MSGATPDPDAKDPRQVAYEVQRRKVRAAAIAKYRAQADAKGAAE